MDPGRAEEHGYPRFSSAEYERRRAAVREVMAEAGVDVLLIYGESGFARHNQANVHYLTGHSGYGPTYLLFFADPTEEPTLFFRISNLLQWVRESSVVEDIRCEQPVEPGIVRRIEEAGAPTDTVGIVGVFPDAGIPHQHWQALQDEYGDLYDVTAAYQQLRVVKSPEEIDWLRAGAALTDAAMEALVEGADVGMSHYELRALVEAAAVRRGGDPLISFISSASMDDPEPGRCLPWREVASRRIKQGDVITTELSAAYGKYPGQIHRPIAVGSAPNDTYADLFEVATETFENVVDVLRPGNVAMDVAEAFAPIEASAYKIYDVGVHGFGMTLEPPFIGTSDEHSNYWPAKEDPVAEHWTFQENQVVVVQPNLTTKDERAGLQLGASVLVQEGGGEVLQEYPVEFPQV